MDVLIYFWDDRDGLELCGWWFGPVVGGDQVWAFHPSRSSLTPPGNEWNIPNDGAIDPTFSITMKAVGGSSSVGKAEEGGDDDAVRKQLELMKKEQQEFEARMKEIQGRAQERKLREEELRKRGLEPEEADKKTGVKRARGAEDDSAAAGARAEEERRRLEAEARKRKEEDERRHAEDEARQRREEEKRKLDEDVARRREERLRQEEEDKRKREERRKNDAEEERKRREVEQVRRREEEERRRRDEAKRMEERQRKLNEEAKRRKEEVAVLGMIEVLTRMACAVPEDFPSLEVMFDRAMETLLPYTGRQRSVLKTEAERVLKRTRGYVKQADLCRQDWEDWYDLRQQMPAALLEE